MDIGELAYVPLAAGFVLGFLFLFFGAVFFGFVGWVKGMLG